MGERMDVDIDDFVRRHDNDIIATLNAAINKHMAVKYYFKCEVDFEREVPESDDLQHTTAQF